MKSILILLTLCLLGIGCVPQIEEENSSASNYKALLEINPSIQSIEAPVGFAGVWQGEMNGDLITIVILKSGALVLSRLDEELNEQMVVNKDHQGLFFITDSNYNQFLQVELDPNYSGVLNLYDSTGYPYSFTKK